MKFGNKILVLGAVAIVAAVGLTALYKSATSKTLNNVTFTRTTDKECKDGTCRYIEYTESEVFENTDEWLFLKFNSSDVHGKIREGVTCEKVKVYGLRIPFMSWYRNIISVDGCSVG